MSRAARDIKSYGINPQSSLMYHCSEELGQTLTVCHGAAVVIRGKKIKESVNKIVESAIQACGDRKNPGISISEESAYTIPANPMSDSEQVVVLTGRQKKGMWCNGEDVTETFTTRSIDTLSPDRHNFAAVIQEVRRKNR